jgi:hypothetical protein
MQQELRTLLRQDRLEAALALLRDTVRPASGSGQQLLLLERRFHGLRNQQIAGTITQESLAVERAKLGRDLLILGEGLPPADRLTTTPPSTIEEHYQDILAQMQFFQSQVEAMTEKIILAGRTMQTLGEALQNPGRSPVPMSELILRGLRKTIRRIELAGTDFSGLRQTVQQGLAQLLERHRRLIDYLDYPDVPPTPDDTTRLRELRGHVATQLAAQERNRSYANTYEPAIELLESGAIQQQIQAASDPTDPATAALLQEVGELLDRVTAGFREFAAQQEAFKAESSALAPRYRNLLLDYDVCLAELGS